MKPRMIFLLLLFASLSSMAQEGSWTWGRKLDLSTPKLVCYDYLNNLYSATSYEKSITLGDTSFSHYYYSNPATNFVLFGYDHTGHFLDATDLYTVEDRTLEVSSVFSDSDMNLYIAGSFIGRFFIDSTTIRHGQVPYLQYPDLFLLKLDPARHLDWAGIYSGFHYDQCLGMGMGAGGELVMASWHMALPVPTPMVLLGQDTITLLARTGLFSGVNTNGQLLWTHPFTFLDDFSDDILPMVTGGDHHFYLTGLAKGIIMGDDTITNSCFPEFYQSPFIISLDGQGNFREVSFLPWELYNMEESDFAVTEKGTKYFSATVYNTVILANDTIILPQDSLNVMIVRFDSLNKVDWYRILSFSFPLSFDVVPFRLTALHDSVFFAIQTKGIFSFEGQTYNTEDSAFLFTGILNPEGNLVMPMLKGSSKEISPGNMLIDHCGNLSLGGSVRGSAVFGADTIISSRWKPVGIISRMQFVKPDTIDLGRDISAHESYTIHGPDRYQHYCWNGGLSWEQDLTVTQTGMYHLQVSNDDLCWKEDSVFVKITELPGVQEKGAGNLRVYPNPVEDYLTVLITDPGCREISATILDAQGVIRGRFWGNGDHLQLDLTGYASGIYFIRIQTENISACEKVIRL